MQIEEEKIGEKNSRVENILDTSVASSLGSEVTPLEVARIEIFTKLIAFVKNEMRLVRTIEWEETIYVKNMMVTPVLMENKKNSSTSRSKQLGLSAIDQSQSRFTNAIPFNDSQFVSQSEFEIPPKTESGRIDINY